MPKQCSPRHGEPGLQPGHHFLHTGFPLPSLQPRGGKGKMVPWALPCECPLVQGQTSPQAALKLAIRDSWSSHGWVSLGVCPEISGHGGACLQLSLSRLEVPSAARQVGVGALGLATNPTAWGWQPPQHILCPTLLLPGTRRGAVIPQTRWCGCLAAWHRHTGCPG